MREVERRSASACNCESSTVNFSTPTDLENVKARWTETECTGADTVPFSSIESGTTIRVAPMERARGGWDDEHFHDDLRVPDGSPVGRGLVVTLEGTKEGSDLTLLL